MFKSSRRVPSVAGPLGEIAFVFPFTLDFPARLYSYIYFFRKMLIKWSLLVAIPYGMAQLILKSSNVDSFM